VVGGLETLLPAAEHVRITDDQVNKWVVLEKMRRKSKAWQELPKHTRYFSRNWRGFK